MKLFYLRPTLNVLTLLLTLLSLTGNCVAQENSNTVYTRIISLYPAHTENLVQLGASDSLIGISASDTYPETILSTPRFHYREDPEKFIAAHPDLVLIRPMIENGYPQFVQKLRQAGITVISLQPNSVTDLYGYWTTLGKLSGKEKRAEQMIAEFKAGLADFKEKLQDIPTASRPKVYFESIHRRMKTFAPDSIALFALNQAGGENVATDSRQVRSTTIADYGKEHILSKAGSIDVFLAQTGRMNPISRETILEEPGFMAIKAVQNDRVYLIKEELISRPTMRILQGITKIHHILYPLKAK